NEGPVLDDGAAGYGPKLVLTECRGACSVDIEQGVARVEEIVADVLEGRAVNVIASGLRDHVHDAARRAAELGFGVMTDDLELRHQINVRDHDICRPADVGVNDAVEEVELRTVLLAMERSVGEA